MNWFLRNFRAKLLAIGVAVSLWTVVAYSETEARTYVVQVDQIPPPPNLMLVKDLPQVKVEVVASTEELKSFDPKGGRLKAKVDLSAVRKGVTTVPVSMEFDSNVTIRKVTPPTIAVELDEKAGPLDKTVGVDPAHVPNGFHVVSKTAKPDKVTIEGPKAQVDVAEAVATVDLDGQQGPIFESPKPVPVEVRDAATKKKLDRLKVTPSEIQVSVTIQSDTQPGSKAVIASSTGQPAAGYRVKSITVNPTTVQVIGQPARLNALTQVQADAVDITGAQADVIKTVAVRVPAGLLDVNPRTVQVHVFIEKNPQVPPPTPTPTPSPTAPPP